MNVLKQLFSEQPHNQVSAENLSRHEIDELVPVASSRKGVVVAGVGEALRSLTVQFPDVAAEAMAEAGYADGYQFDLAPVMPINSAPSVRQVEAAADDNFALADDELGYARHESAGGTASQAYNGWGSGAGQYTPINQDNTPAGEALPQEIQLDRYVDAIASVPTTAGEAVNSNVVDLSARRAAAQAAEAANLEAQFQIDAARLAIEREFGISEAAGPQTGEAA